MMQAVSKLFPRVKVRYKFINRGGTKFPDGFGVALRKEIATMAYLSLSREEKDFMKLKCGRYMDDVFIDLFSSYRYDPAEVGVIQTNGDLDITIEGYWYKTINWEVSLMALISELYFKMTNQKPNDRNIRQKNNAEKGVFFYGHNMKLSDFGTRRRFSYENQLEVCSDLKKVFGSDSYFVGTSNINIAMKLGLTPIGTHAHEWFMFMAAKYGYKMANQMALEHWVDVYQGDLGTALSDTYTTDIFLKTFDRKYAKLFDGPRHDSGDPFSYIDKFVSHYNNLGIRPDTKTIIFSNNLNKDAAFDIQKYCNEKGQGIKASFGIGTNLTNDVGVKPLNIVIKMVAAYINDEWVSTVKLSDDLEKNTGDSNAVSLAKQILGVGNKNKPEPAI